MVVFICSKRYRGAMAAQWSSWLVMLLCSISSEVQLLTGLFVSEACTFFLCWWSFFMPSTLTWSKNYHIRLIVNSKLAYVWVYVYLCVVLTCLDLFHILFKNTEDRHHLLTIKQVKKIAGFSGTSIKGETTVLHFYPLKRRWGYYTKSNFWAL